jgi:hypothetical protein
MWKEGEGQAPSADYRPAMGGRPAHHCTRHERHSSIKAAAYAGSVASIPTCGDCRSGIPPARGIRRATSKSRHRRMGMTAAISNASPVWRFGNSREAGDGIDQSPPATSDSATNYFLGALGRRCRKRTPGPPPFSSMNSTPAASKARRTAKSFAAVREVWSSATSARRMVFRPNAASRARSSAVHLRRARAARI